MVGLMIPFVVVIGGVAMGAGRSFLTDLCDFTSVWV